MDQLEIKWDKLLKIRTSGRDDSHADQYKYPYEPTPYSVLERLSREGFIRKKNVFMDYGCGKGRASLYFSFETGCRSIGIEYDTRLFEAAMRNKECAVRGQKTEFILTDAAAYIVPAEADRLYFFNPFSVEILKKVMARVTDSYYEAPRQILMFFYYPSDEYVAALMTMDNVDFVDEIDCRDLFEGDNSRERIMIWEMV